MASKSTPPAGLIDAHVHISGWQNNDINYIEALRRYRMQNKLAAIGVVCVPFLGPDQKRNITENLLASILKDQDPHIYSFGGLVYPTQPMQLPFPDEIKPEQQLKELLAAGFDGVKMLEGKPTARRQIGLPLCSPAYDEYYSLLESKEVHLIWHVADPAQFWDPAEVNEQMLAAGWFYGGDGGFITRNALYEELWQVLTRFPKLKVTFAHFLFLEDEPELAAKLLDDHPGLCFDLTPHWRMYVAFSKERQMWQDFFQTYADRLILGTDNCSGYEPERQKRQLDFVWRFLMTDDELELAGQTGLQGLALPAAVVEKISSANFLVRTGAKPKSITKTALKDYLAANLVKAPRGTLQMKIEEYMQSGLI